jgi:ribosomal protein L5
MAKESMKARERKRAKLVARYAEKRARLKEEGDYQGLARLPKNSAAIRMHNRCSITGRPKGFDGRGNYNLGITEHIIFPEIDIDKVNRILGMDITFVTSAETNEEGLALLKEFGMPFKK